jgi:hypothetical protein
VAATSKVTLRPRNAGVFSLLGDATLSFSFQNNACVNRLNAGTSCSTVVRASGSVLGTHTGTVNFKSASGLLKIPFSFSVVPMDIGVTTVTAAQDTTVGKGTVSSYAVKTNSTGPVIVKPPTISGNTAEYSVAAGSNCNGIVAINSSCAVNVLFTPTAAGPRPQGTLSFTGGGIVRTLALNGRVAFHAISRYTTRILMRLRDLYVASYFAYPRGHQRGRGHLSPSGTGFDGCGYRRTGVGLRKRTSRLL